jgi:hypothetical protein
MKKIVAALVTQKTDLKKSIEEIAQHLPHINSTNLKELSKNLTIQMSIGLNSYSLFQNSIYQSFYFQSRRIGDESQFAGS